MKNWRVAAGAVPQQGVIERVRVPGAEREGRQEDNK